MGNLPQFSPPTASGETRPRTRERRSNLDLVALGTEKLAREASLNWRRRRDQAGDCMRSSAQAQRSHCSSRSQSPQFRARIRARIAPIASPAVPNPVELEARSHHLPFRFVWKTDAKLGSRSQAKSSPTFLDKTAAGLDRSGLRLPKPKLDPQAQIAMRSQLRTFSGIVVSTSRDSNEASRRDVGVPMFDRERQFGLSRGICRNLDNLEVRRLRMQSAPASPANIHRLNQGAPFPSAPQPRRKNRHSPRERGAFQSLHELSKRLKNQRPKPRPPSTTILAPKPMCRLPSQRADRRNSSMPTKTGQSSIVCRSVSWSIVSTV